MFDLSTYRAQRDAQLLVRYQEEIASRRAQLARHTARYDADLRALDTRFRHRLATLMTLGFTPREHNIQKGKALAAFRLDAAGLRAAILHERSEIRRLQAMYDDLLREQPIEMEYA